tara:strand:- start:1553 stop:2173 length:621 start_codon:yes stop_codon:yes gene_type:complete
MKYRLISNDIIKNLIEFLDEIQFEAAKVNSTDAHHQVNFCNWAINELLNSYNVMTMKDFKTPKDDPKKPNKKSRDDYVEETFMDWNLPEMSDKEYEKLVDQFDAFLRGWEKEYYKDNPKKKPEEDRKDREGKEWKPQFKDVVEHCSLDEIKDMLLDDPELTDEERFELYYQEHERVQAEKNSYTLEELYKKVGIKPYKEPPKNKKN